MIIFCFRLGADPDYNPQPTSYDYDAPISEAGLLVMISLSIVFLLIKVILLQNIQPFEL
jgi:hypothetical protein